MCFAQGEAFVDQRGELVPSAGEVGVVPEQEQGFDGGRDRTAFAAVANGARQGSASSPMRSR